MRRYRDRPEETARIIDDGGWLHTGELPRSPAGKLLRRVLVEAERAGSQPAPDRRGSTG
jgi:acyl-CoA synthetase (AMP-forming)/AMP-acid ligase II